jgi:hypothetical protein
VNLTLKEEELLNWDLNGSLGQKISKNKVKLLMNKKFKLNKLKN